MTWFEALTGIRETAPAHVRQNLSIEGDKLRSRVSPSLAQKKAMLTRRGGMSMAFISMVLTNRGRTFYLASGTATCTAPSTALSASSCTSATTESLVMSNSGSATGKARPAF